MSSTEQNAEGSPIIRRRGFVGFVTLAKKPGASRAISRSHHEVREVQAPFRRDFRTRCVANAELKTVSGSHGGLRPLQTHRSPAERHRSIGLGPVQSEPFVQCPPPEPPLEEPPFEEAAPATLASPLTALMSWLSGFDELDCCCCCVCCCCASVDASSWTNCMMIAIDVGFAPPPPGEIESGALSGSSVCAATRGAKRPRADH